MKNKIIGSAVLAACTALASTAVLAQDNGRHDQNWGRGGPPQHQMDRNDHGRPGPGPQAHRGPPPHAPAYGRRGAGPRHNFYKGGRLPAQYRRHPYIIEDWRVHHLSEPPRGYYWVQAGNDFLLTAIATGLIAQVILNN